MMLLGRGDLAVGYSALAWSRHLPDGPRAGRPGLVQGGPLRAIFPASVVEGMLASIGLLIIAKQLPLLLGHEVRAHEFWGIVAEAPSQFLKMEPKVFVLGISAWR